VSEQQNEQAQEEQKPTTSRQRASQQPQQQGEQTFNLDRLRRDAQPLLGVSRTVVVGALHGQDRDEWSLADAKARIDEWLKTPVKGTEKQEEEVQTA
jgi:hypothetical protein